MGIFPLVVFGEEVLKHLVSVGPAKVNIKVRWIFSVEVDEALKVEVQLHGIYIGDSQTVGHHGVGPRSSAYMVEIAAMGKLHDVVVDQEIRHKTLLLDQLQLLFNALADCCRELGIALLGSSEGFLAEKFKVFPSSTK